jgi:D-alanyl-D-alanine dipeptidase
MTTPGGAAAMNGIVLMADLRVATIPVIESGEELTDVRDHALGVSTLVADDAGDFAHVRVGLAARLAQAQEALPRRIRLLLIEGYRPPARQRSYFEEYLDSLRQANPGSSEEQLRMLASRYVSPTEWWHWSYGDRYWAMASGRGSAIYGPVTRH